MTTPAHQSNHPDVSEPPSAFDRAVLDLREAIRAGRQGLAAAALRVFLTPRRTPASAAQQRLLAGARRVTFGVDGLPVQGYVWEPTDGAQFPPVLLVHGWASHAGQLAVLATELRARGHRVIAIDGPAHGATGGDDTDLVRFGRAVRRVIETYGRVHAVIGHSFGAASAALALAHDPRLRGRVGRLALIGAPSALPDVMRQFLQQSKLPAELLPGMIALLEERHGLAIEAYDLGRMGERLDLPTLVVHDREDDVIPFERAERNAAALPDAELLETSGLGHNRVLKDPEVLGRIAAFTDAQGSEVRVHCERAG